MKMDNIDDINDAQVRVCVVYGTASLSESLCLVCIFLYYLGQNTTVRRNSLESQASLLHIHIGLPMLLIGFLT